MYATPLELHHRSGAELQRWYQDLIVENDTYVKKGEFMKQSSWYSIVKLIARQDGVWHARRWQAERVAQLLTGNKGKQIVTDLVKDMQNAGGTAVITDPGVADPGGTVVKADPGATTRVIAHHGDAVTTKESCLAEMKALRKRVGNCLLLAPLLLHDRNLLNARIMLLVAQTAWTEQTWLSTCKTTSAQDREVSVLNSTGLGESMVMQAWVKATHHPLELARLGIAVKEGQVCLDLDPSIGRDEPVTTLMSFLLHFMEARLWSALWQEESMPEKFAGVLDPVHQARILEHLALFWVAVTDVEAMGQGDAWELRKEIYWLSWPLCQHTMRLMAHHHWQAAGPVVDFLSVLFNRLGDSKCIEESHRVARSLEKRRQQPDVVSMHSAFGALQGDATPLSARGVPHVRTPTSGAYTASVKQPFKWQKIFGKHALLPLPPSCKRTLKSSGFKSKTPHSGRPSICAAAALAYLHESGKLHLAGEMFKSIILVPHSLVRNGSDVFLVVCQGRFAARAWLATKIPRSRADLGGRWAFVATRRLVWIFVERVEDWRFIPMDWVVNAHDTHTFGCVVAQERGDGEQHVPALAEALVTAGRSRLMMHDRPTLAGAGGKAAEFQKIEELLRGHTLLPHYVKRLQEWHDEMEAKTRRRQRRARERANLDKGEAPPPTSSESSSEAEEQVDPKQKAFTCAALQELDEANLREWKADKRINQLIGQRGERGVRHAARQVLRRERTKRQPPRGDVKQRVVRCNVPWASRYVPGAAESGMTLPEGCRQSTLNAPPNLFVWVARYRHPLLELQNPPKRPTHSKNFTPPKGEAGDGRTEHQAFQKVLRWLWDRHEEVCAQTGTASHRPEWVSTALAPCSSCTAPGECECSFISEQRVLAPATMLKGAIEDLSGDSEDWSGEGTSETMSSCDDKPRLRLKTKTTQARSRRPPVDTGHKALPRAVTTPISGRPPSRAPLRPPVREGLHQVLAVGDANAKELGTLLELADVTVTIRARPGASWQNVGKDIEAFVSEGLPGTCKHKFHMVLIVLGSNNFPTTKARATTWENTRVCIKAVLAGLKECLIIGQPASNVFLSAPFNLEPKVSIPRLLKELREAAENAGASFIPIEWLPEHGDIEAPEKHLNVAGKQLLADSFLQASQPPKPASGPSCTPQPSPPPSAVIFKRSPTTVSSRSSSSSSQSKGIPTPVSSCSSRSSSSSSKQSGGHRGGPRDTKSHPPGGHEAQTALAVTDPGTSQAPAPATHQEGLVCQICNARDHHDSTNCPLAWACSTGKSSVVEMVAQAMSKLGKIMPRPMDRSVVVAKKDIGQVVPMPSDGNCLFAALAVGYKAASGLPVPTPDLLKALGAFTRQSYLKLVKNYLALKKREVMGLPIDSLLTDSDWTSVEEYLKGMEPPITTRRQWGGFVEAAIMGYAWQMQVAFFLEYPGGDVVMMTEPVGTGTKGPLLTQTRRALALVSCRLEI